jgi:uncharacterized protein DUF3618
MNLSDEPAVIEREIDQRRAALHRKLDELQHRLNPRERVMEAVGRVDPRSYAQAVVDNAPNYAGAAALAAIGVGTALAVRGLRRCYPGDDSIEPGAVDMMGE